MKEQNTVLVKLLTKEQCGGKCPKKGALELTSEGEVGIPLLLDHHRLWIWMVLGKTGKETFVQVEPSCNIFSVGIAGKKRRHSPSGGTACAKPSDEKEYGTLENWGKPR